MTIHQENQQAVPRNDLLTPREQAICKQIATRDAPHSQRAMALLALNERSTQAQAAEQAGLSTGQVKYWIAKFRKQRLGIFPDTRLDELDVEAAVELVTEVEEEPEAVTEKVGSAVDKTKDAKAKKGKRAKPKPKKAKKAKKGKKVKNTEQKSKKAKPDKKGKKAKKGKRAKKTEQKSKKAKPDKKGKTAKKTKKKPS